MCGGIGRPGALLRGTGTKAASSVHKVAWLEGSPLIAALGDSLSVWDAEAGVCVGHYAHGSQPLCTLEALPRSAQALLGGGSGGCYNSVSSTHSLLVGASEALCVVDVRTPARHAHLAAEWRFGGPHHQAPSTSGTGVSAGAGAGAGAGSSNASSGPWVGSDGRRVHGGGGSPGLLQATCSLPGGRAAAGFTSGTVSVVDMRAGGLLHSWQAHSSPIVKLLPLYQDSLLTVSADGSATLWKLDDCAPAYDSTVALPSSPPASPAAPSAPAPSPSPSSPWWQRRWGVSSRMPLSSGGGGVSGSLMGLHSAWAQVEVHRLLVQPSAGVLTGNAVAVWAGGSHGGATLLSAANNQVGVAPLANTQQNKQGQHQVTRVWPIQLCCIVWRVC